MNKYLVTLEYPPPDNCARGRVDWVEVEAVNERLADHKARRRGADRIRVRAYHKGAPTDATDATDATPRELDGEIEAAFNALGVCPRCMTEIEHDFSEPFASCNCGTREWPFKEVSKLPLLMRRQYQRYLDRQKDGRIS